jgi:hypothetical protein
MKKEKSWCTLEPNWGCQGPVARQKMDLKTQNWHFFEIFQKFQKYVFFYHDLSPEGKIWGSLGKTGYFGAKNVIFRISGNIYYLKSNFCIFF